jgi:hypothetical protein
MAAAGIGGVLQVVGDEQGGKEKGKRKQEKGFFLLPFSFFLDKHSA